MLKLLSGGETKRTIDGGTSIVETLIKEKQSEGEQNETKHYNWLQENNVNKRIFIKR